MNQPNRSTEPRQEDTRLSPGYVRLTHWQLTGVLCLAFLFAYTQFIIVYSDYHGWDYAIYAHAGRYARLGETPYTETLYLYPPTLAVLMAPMSYLGRETGYWLWTIISLGAYAYAVSRAHSIGRSSSRCSGSRFMSRSTRDR